MLIRSTAIAASLILLLTGCWRTVDTTWTAFVPITYSPKMDSPETVTQVRQFNAAWVALCH